MRPPLTHVKLDMFCQALYRKPVESDELLIALGGCPCLKVLHLRWMNATLGSHVDKWPSRLERLSLYGTPVTQPSLCQWLIRLETTVTYFYFSMRPLDLNLPGPGVPVKARLVNLKTFKVGDDDADVMRFLEETLEAPVEYTRVDEEEDSW
ncbi:hypothetical protein ACM66B_005565 [Microbotryomycetes sp. NB124-2]